MSQLKDREFIRHIRLLYVEVCKYKGKGYIYFNKKSNDIYYNIAFSSEPIRSLNYDPSYQRLACQRLPTCIFSSFDKFWEYVQQEFNFCYKISKEHYQKSFH